MLADLCEVIREARGGATLDETLAIIVSRLERDLHADACAVYLTEPGTRRYVLMASRGLSAASAGQDRSGRAAGLLGFVGERRELVVLPNAAAHARYCSADRTSEAPLQAFLGIPLIHRHHVLGVLVAWKRAGRRFEPDEMTFFVTIAGQLAGIIHEAAAVAEVARLASGETGEKPFIQGVAATGGAAVGIVALLAPAISLASVPDRLARDLAAEEAAFRSAIAATRKEFASTRARLAGVLPGEMRELIDVYVMMLGSDEMLAGTVERIRAGNWAPGAWRQTIDDHARIFDQLKDPYLRARASDLREIGARVFGHLRPEVGASRQFPQSCILVGDAVGVTDIAAVPAGRLAGIVCKQGSTLSHTAVLARALGIPAVVSLATMPAGLIDGCTMAVDGDRGRIYVNPAPGLLAGLERRIGRRRALSGQLAALRDLPARTPDGVRIPLYANIGLAADIDAARESAAEGVGLYRTEYEFLLRDTFPLEDQQFQVYRRLLQAFAPMPVTIRTLDVGGDKILPYFPVEEANPFLGCRGIRFSLEHPEMFVIQLRAMLRANAGLHNLKLLLPMISRIGEVDDALEIVARAHAELEDEGQATSRPSVGAMIEVPSAVFSASALAARVDFLSIGTNDLAQYMLAIDRTNAQVTTAHDSLHPAVLDAVRSVARDAHASDTPVTVCGETAGDPAGALVLLGLGVDGLSMNAASLSRVKQVIRTFTAERARALADEALEQEDGWQVSRLLNAALGQAGLRESVGADPADESMYADAQTVAPRA